MLFQPRSDWDSILLDGKNRSDFLMVPRNMDANPDDASEYWGTLGTSTVGVGYVGSGSG
jgi:hypothetical protein